MTVIAAARAPGVTVRLEVGIGRLVFAALNRIEVVLLIVIVGALVAGPHPAPVVWAAAPPAVLLAAVRPALTRRSERVLAGEEVTRSRAHLLYLGLEVMKVVALVALGVTALAQ